MLMLTLQHKDVNIIGKGKNNQISQSIRKFCLFQRADDWCESVQTIFELANIKLFGRSWHKDYLREFTSVD